MQPNLSGQTLGKYELRELLGEGGMGAVYRAYDHNLKREVAVKIINLAKNDTALRGRFIREAETAASLEHSHIVRIYDYGVERDINYIVMQNLTGGALSDRMKQASEDGRPRASLPEVALLLDQLASALDYAHAQGVIHRDIKPQNVMFNNQGQAFIVDFGIAKLLTGATNMTGTGMAMGTPSYMSPEQWTTDNIVPASDQYALAVMMYQLIAGRLPFEADTPMRVMYRHLNDQPTPLNTFRPDIPADLLLVMDRALAKDPEQRFPNCTQFAQAFSSAVSAVSAGKTEFFTFKLARIRPSSVPYTPTPRQPSSTPATPASNLSLPAIPLTQQPKSGPSRSVLIGGLGALVVMGILAVLLLGNRGPSDSDLRLTEVNSTLISAGLATGRIETRVAGLELIETETPEPTNTAEPTATYTDQPSPITSNTDAPTSTNAPTQMATNEPSNTPTDTATASPTATSSNTPTNTATPTPTLIASLTPTATFTFTPTLSPREAALATLEIGATETAALWTLTPIATLTPTEDYEATVYSELTAVYLEALTATATVWTLTPTITLTDTPSFTPTVSSTPTINHTFTPQATHTPVSTARLSPEELAMSGISRNEDWTPLERDHGGTMMVLVPVGCFSIGSNEHPDEQPVHRFCFSEPFWLDKTEVTQGKFELNNGRKAIANAFTGDELPVEHITWFEARNYCESIGGRLPTEPEWEYSARGPSNLVYPWGNSFVAENVVDGNNSGGRTARVSSRPEGASWVGAQDLAGNVREWTSSLFKPYRYDAKDAEVDSGERIDVQRVLRGGSWDYQYLHLLRASARLWGTPNSHFFNYGFRCARDFDGFGTTAAVTITDELSAANSDSAPTLVVPTPQPTLAASGDQPTVTVNVESANLRAGPGTNYAIVGVAKRGGSFEIVAQAQGWYLAKTTSDEFVWISGAISEIYNPTSSTIEVAATVPAAPQAAQSEFKVVENCPALPHEFRVGQTYGLSGPSVRLSVSSNPFSGFIGTLNYGGVFHVERAAECYNGMQGIFEVNRVCLYVSIPLQPEVFRATGNQPINVGARGYMCIAYNYPSEGDSYSWYY